MSRRRSLFLLSLAVLMFSVSREAPAPLYTTSTTTCPPKAKCADGSCRTWCLGSDVVVGGCDVTGGTTEITPSSVTQDQTAHCVFTGGLFAGQQDDCTINLQVLLHSPTQCLPNNDGTFSLAIRQTCADLKKGTTFSGALRCPNLNITDNLGFNPRSAATAAKDCASVYGTDGVILLQNITYSDSNCTLQANITPKQSNVCHADSTLASTDPACKDGKDKQKAGEEVGNVTTVACVIKPDSVNTNCAGNKDQGVVHLIFIGDPDDPNAGTPIAVGGIDQGTVKLEGVSTTGCTFVDFDFDPVADLSCSFPSCIGNNSIVPPSKIVNGSATLSGTAAYTGTGSLIRCTDTIKTTQ